MFKNPFRLTFFAFTAFILLSSCSKKIIPDKPFLSKTRFSLDSLPESEINIPIQINLRPLYSMAEKNVDTLYTSPGWPNGWINLDCATRYRYQFRRSPLQLSASGQTLNIGFTGFYKVIGSTRVCIGGTVLSPWTPPCRCGFDEPERRVKVSFSSSVSVQPDYKIRMNIVRNEPEPLDHCQVCFVGIDITSQVMNGLKEELDLAKKSIEDSFSVVDIRPQVQQLWSMLSEPYNLYGLGWLQINPRRLRINNLFARNDSLNIFLGMTAQPMVRFEKPQKLNTIVPNMNDYSPHSGFNIFLDAVLNYDSLTQILNTQLKGKRFDFDKGPASKKYIIVTDSRIYGEGNEKLVIKMSFTGTNSGIAYFTGKPVYNEKTKQIEIADIDFDIKTKNLVMKTASWMFNRRIINEISEYTRFDLAHYIDTAKQTMHQQLNREWIKGVRSYGILDDLKIAGFYPLSDHLIIRSNASGSLLLRIDSIDFALQ